MPQLPAILDVAIGMTLIFLTLSAICSSVNEIIANFLKLRAAFLEQGIMNLLGDPSIARQLIEHPLLTQPGSQPRTLPAYIASESFALALMDLLRRRAGPPAARVERLRIEIEKIASSTIRQPLQEALANPDAAKALENLHLAISLVQDEKVRSSISDFLSVVEVGEIKRGILALSDPRVQQVLLALLNEAETQVQRLEDTKARIEGWFNDGMNRVSVLYKRYIDRILRVLAVLICVTCNADAFRIINSLWQDPTLRAAIVAEAQNVANSSSTPPQSGAATTGSRPTSAPALALEQLSGFPLGWSCDDYNDIARSGWKVSETTAGATPKSPSEYGFCENVGGQIVVGGGFSLASLLLKILGLGVMSAGVSLGAPFWFDALQKLVSIRPDKK